MSEHHESIVEHGSAAEQATGATAVGPTVIEPTIAGGSAESAEPGSTEAVTGAYDPGIRAGHEDPGPATREQELDRISQLPLRDQPAAYHRIHDDLQRALADIDEA